MIQLNFLKSSIYEKEYLEGNNTTSASSGQTGPQVTPPLDTPQLLPGEVVKFSGKYPQLTKIPGKNFFKDEVIIRNSDSGKGTIFLKNCLAMNFMYLKLIFWGPT